VALPQRAIARSWLIHWRTIKLEKSAGWRNRLARTLRVHSD
jgi:hypothetical protein